MLQQILHFEELLQDHGVLQNVKIRCSTYKNHQNEFKFTVHYVIVLFYHVACYSCGDMAPIANVRGWGLRAPF